MREALVNPGLPDPLEERLAQALPRLEAHLAGRGRRVPGLEPDDLAQEVLARALRYRDSYDERRALWPWLRQLAQRVVHDQRAAGARRPAQLEDHEPAAARVSEPLETREELARLLSGLRPIEREVLLRFHQRLESVAEIALALGQPEGTVKSHLSRARRRLAGLSEREQRHE